MKFQVEYYTTGEAIRIAVVDSPNVLLIPFKMKESGVKDLRRVKSHEEISDKEYNEFNRKLDAPVEAMTPHNRKKTKSNDPYEAAHGYIFIKDGDVGSQYVIGGVIYKLIKIGESSVTASPWGGIGITISPYSEGIPFDIKKHAHYIPKKRAPEE